MSLKPPMLSSNLKRFLVWVLLTLVTIITLVLRLSEGVIIESNILKAVPSITQIDAVGNFLNNRTTSMVHTFSHSDFDSSLAAAEKFSINLKSLDAFSKVNLRQNIQKFDVLATKLFPFRYQMLSRESIQDLQLGDSLVTFLKSASYRLHEPFSPLSSSWIKQDPFLVFRSYMEELPRPKSLMELDLDEGVLFTEYEGQTVILLYSNLKKEYQSGKQASSLIEKINVYEEELTYMFPNLKINRAGFVFHSRASEQAARRDIMFISTVSLLGIVTLFLIFFRSLVPLILGVLSLLSAICGALAFNFILFDELHILSVVFGTTLVGISIDYSFHFFCHNRSDAFDSGYPLNRALLYGLITSCFGFFGFFFSSLEILYQMACMCIVGLIYAYLTVVLAFPVLTRNGNATLKVPGFISKLLDQPSFLVGRFSSRFKINVLLSLIFLSCLGLFKARYVDDLNQLQPNNKLVENNENTLRKITGLTPPRRFILVQGHNFEDLLQKEESIIEWITKHSPTSVHFQAISSIVPSKRKQVENINLLKSQLSKNPQVLKYFKNHGFSIFQYDSLLLDLQINNGGKLEDFFTFENILEDSNFDAWKFLLLDTEAFQSMVQLEGPLDSVNMLVEKLPDALGIVFKLPESLSDNLKTTRINIQKTLLICYTLMFMVLSLSLGLMNALKILLIPLFSSIASLSIIALFVPLNLFHILAILLVMGVGIDYGIFLYFNVVRTASVRIGILLSFITSIFSFGLLQLSNFAALKSFGQVSFVGITLCFILSLVMQNIQKSQA